MPGRAGMMTSKGADRASRSSLAGQESGPAASGVRETTRRTSWAWTVSTFFGAGLLKPGPGTWGSIAAAMIWYFGLRAAHLTGIPAMLLTAGGALVVTLIGIPAASVVEREYGREDPGFVVIDEVAGQWIALMFAPIDWG